MRVLERVADLRAACDAARRAGERVGLVLTMGFFHEGHRSLMRAARAENDLVVTTLFVNPLQFGPDEDLDSYPRDLEGDAAAASAEEVDVLFVPPVREMYPGGTRTTVHVAGLSGGLCGAARPTHFDGVTTVVAKLFAIVGPCRAYFGRKDAQQLAVVTRMVADLDLPVEVVGCPIVREADGVAMSSRNAYLTAADRSAATVLFGALRDAVRDVERGERSTEVIRTHIVETVVAEPRVELEYVEVRTVDDLEPIATLSGKVLIALAAKVGPARLIDNVTVSVTDRVTADLGIAVTDDRQMIASEEEQPCAAP